MRGVLAARVLLAVLVVAALGGCAGTAPKAGSHGACSTRGYNLPGAPCLVPGARCDSTHQREYLDDQFGCAAGKLESLAAPAEPRLTTPLLPAAAPLPAATARVHIPAPDWSGGGVALGPGAVWIPSDSATWRIEKTSLKTSGPFARSSGGAFAAAGDGAVWVTDFDGSVVHRLDVQTGREEAKIAVPAPGNPTGIVALPSAVWVGLHRGGVLTRIDPSTNGVTGSVVVGLVGTSGPIDLASGFGSIWVTVPNINSVVRVDPLRAEVTAFIPLPADVSACGSIGFGTDAVWVSSCFDGKYIARIDPRTNRLRSVLDLGGLVQDIATSGDVAYLVAGGDPDSSPETPGRLIELRADDTVSRVFDLGAGFLSGGAAFDSGALWLVDFAHPLVLRVPIAGNS
jgi:hypothetical protein